MKINQVVEDVERGSVTQERGFSIQANARAFQILSSNLYSDKITAVIRELSCNALDSHVAAGKTGTPFDVHLPNALEPYFSVQDYGLGLSHDQVMSIYTTYFESTKTNTNELIGGLGLGSKSPFSYTSSFDVVSVHNGVSRSYAMFINEAGKPSVAFMGETPTDAPNGVKVSMPVKSTDFQGFQEKAARVFKWFSHRPVVSGSSSFVIPELKINCDIQGQGWRLQDVSFDRYSRHQAMALMGNVAYPLNAAVINTKFQQLLAWPIIIDFAIGELDISASREDLSYDPVTVQVIETKLGQIIKELEKRIQDKFKNAATLWEARLLLKKMTSDRTLNDILYVMERGGFRVMWKGEEVSHHHINWHKMFLDVDTDPHPPVYDVSTFSRARYCRAIEPTDKVVFILKDVSDTSARCKLAYYNTQKRAFMIEAAIGNDATKCPQVARLLKHIGDPPTILGSSLSKAPRKSMKFKGIVWTGNSRTWQPRKSDNWTGEKELLSSQGGYYVTISGLDPVYIVSAKEEKQLNLNDIVHSAQALGILAKTDQVWGINKTNSRLIKDEPKWINVYEFVQKKVLELISNGNTADLVHAREQYELINTKFYTNHDVWTRMFGNHDNSLGKFVRAWKNAAVAGSKMDLRALRTLVTVYGVDLEGRKTVKTESLIDMWSQAVKDYPMLVKFERDSSGDIFWPLLVDYVNFVDITKK
jgi:hypothetical protein